MHSLHFLTFNWLNRDRSNMSYYQKATKRHLTLLIFPYTQFAQSLFTPSAISLSNQTLTRYLQGALYPLSMSLYTFCSITCTSSAIYPSYQKLIRLFKFTILSTIYTATQPLEYQRNVMPSSLFSMSLHSFLSKANCHSDSLPRNN